VHSNVSMYDVKHCRIMRVDYVEPATTAPFHIEDDELQMINNDERLAVSFFRSSVIPTTFTLSSAAYRICDNQ